MYQPINFIPVYPGQHTLPPLPYPYNALEPVIDRESLKIHHDILHKNYVDNLNKAELALASSRETGNFEFINYWENQLAYNGSGHILHSIYWTIMAPRGRGGQPRENTLRMINWYFGDFNNFENQFKNAAKKVEASGWAILIYHPAFNHLEILQCEKHQNLTQWGCIPILVCDVWEHAYYLDYQNDRSRFVDSWWELINWNEVERRLYLARQGKLPLSI